MYFIDRIRRRLWHEMNPFFCNRFILPYYRRRFNNPEVTILSNNCLGGCLAHDLGIRFNSPTVNLWMSPKDFIKLCPNVRLYMAGQLCFIKLPDFRGGYPIAKLEDITIYFQHYHTEEEARMKWQERCKRINYDDIRCIMIERDGCTLEDLCDFSDLPFPTAALVHNKKEGMPNTHIIRGFEHDDEVGNIMLFRPRSYLGHKFYDDFDFVSFLNK